MIHCKSEGVINCEVKGHCDCYNDYVRRCCWCNELPEESERYDPF